MLPFLTTSEQRSDFQQATARLKRSDVRRLSKIPGFALIAQMLGKISGPASVIVTAIPVAEVRKGRTKNLKSANATIDIRFKAAKGTGDAEAVNQNSRQPKDRPKNLRRLQDGNVQSEGAMPQMPR